MVSGLRVMGGAAGRRRTEPSAMQGTALLFVSSIAMTLAFSRGIFDLYGAQILGYLLQYACLGILALTTFWRAVVEVPSRGVETARAVCSPGERKPTGYGPEEGERVCPKLS
jgi:hypothetical protein